MRDVFEVVTPENVTFEYELAGLASRALAALIDILLMASFVGGAAVALSVAGLLLGGLAMALYFVAAFAVQWGYGTLCEWRLRGQTVGKRMLGLRVLSQEAAPLSFNQALVRNLLRVVDLMPSLYMVGGASALLDGQMRRLGDIAAGTVVVRTRHRPRPTAVAPPSERHNSFVADPQVVHAAGRITAAEREAMLGLSLRREQLPLSVRFLLFRRLAGHLQARLGVVCPSYFSDEKFVLNLAAVHLEQGTLLGSETSTPPAPGRQESAP